MTASDVFSFSQLLRCKDGRTVRLDDQSQVFYDRNGNVLSLGSSSSLDCTLALRVAMG